MVPQDASTLAGECDISVMYPHNESDPLWGMYPVLSSL